MADPRDVYVNYEFITEPKTNYSIKVRIGDAQPGDIKVSGSCSFSNKPINDKTEWESKLDVGEKVKDKNLVITATTQNTNPSSEYLSVRVFINGEELIPTKGKNITPAQKNEIVSFGQLIEFK